MKKFLLLIALIISGLGLNAQSVGSSSIVYYDGYSLKFTVTKLDPAECKVVCDTKPTTPIVVSIPSSVTIEGSTFSVTSIGESAFSFSNLTGIEIPSSVTSIGNYAFGWCNNLTGIEIPNSVTSIGDNAFDTSKVESIIVVEGNPNYDSRNNCNAIIETQTNTLLYGCKNTIIPNTVTYIGEDAFDGCIGLTNIEIPNSVTSIGVSAFYNCSGLTSIEIPNSVTFIGEYAFYNCNDLTSIEIPNSVTSIGVCAFRSCYGLKSIVVEGGNPNYDSRNNCNAIIETQTNTLLHGCMNTIIPNSVTSIGESAFRACYGLKSIEIPNSVTSIGNYAFNYTGLTSIKCHAVDVPVTATDAFDNCPEDMTIQVPEESVALYQAAEPWKNYNVTEIHLYQIGDYVVVDYEGYSLRYTIIKLEPAECEVICETEPTTEISITIPSSVEIEGVVCNVTKIGRDAFDKCSSKLTSIEIPNSVTSIGNSAFSFCSKLTSIEIPNSVTSIGYNAFSSCDGLESFVVEGGNPNYDSRNNCNAIIETQTNTLLYGCMNTIIPNSVTSIGNSAFFSCSGLTSIEIPNSVTSIGNSAFYDCDGLTSIEIPNSVTSIGNFAFSLCYGLTSIKCHAVDVPVTATNAFNYCPEDMNIQVPEESVALYQAAQPWSNYNVTKMYPYQNGDYVVIDYEGYSLRFTIENVEPAECEVVCETEPETGTSITIPSSVEIGGVECSVTKIGNAAFYNCNGLTSIEIPNSVTSIGNGAFYDCDGLTSIEIPNNVTSIGASTFNDCNGLTSIEIPNNVTSIGNSAFYNCDGLTSIEIPNSVTSIGDRAFSFCSGLTSIEIPNSVTSIGNSAFYYCNGLTSIEIPNSVTSIGNSAFSHCSNLESIIVENGNTVYDSRDNCNAIIETQTNTLLYGCMNTIIPNSVTSIGNSAFYYCNGLTSIEIPNSVTSIGNSAFSFCSGLTSIEIPNSVTSIGNEAFYYCNGLTSIEIPNSVTSIGESAFLSCSHLRSIKCHAVDVPVTAINAFNNCPEDMNIQVPAASLTLYQNAVPWNNYNITPFLSYGDYSLSFEVTSSDPAECIVFCSGNPATETSVNIPSEVTIGDVTYSVTTIGYEAFIECSNITSIVIPNSVTTISPYAFDGCTGLTSIMIPRNVTTIERGILAGCINIATIEVDDDNSVYNDNGNAIMETATNTLIAGCRNTVIPDNTTSIAAQAFRNCNTLTNIDIPNTVTYIGKSAFYGCYGLTGNLTIPNSVTYIGGYAFWECRGFDGTLTLPDNIDTIREYTFGSYEGEMGFTGDLIIPDNVRYIGETAFQKCSNLTGVKISDNVSRIERYTFNNCSSLTSVEFPNSVKYIGPYSFTHCSALTEITFEENSQLDTILGFAFYKCEALLNVNFPNSLVYIGMESFSGCSSLKSIVLPESWSFYGLNAFINCYSLESIIVDEDNPYFDSRNNCNAIIFTETNHLLLGCKNTIIPNDIISIGNLAFYNCKGLTDIKIPNSVTSIGNNAFSYCSNLTSVKCHAENVPTTKITAFNNCPEDMTIQVPEESVALYQAAEPWKNYNIVAGFNSTINLTSNIEEGGFVEGSGNYQDGTEITVYAYVNPNYGFLYWSENDEIVSYSPEYTFTVSNDRNLTANFAINHWIPDYTIYPNTMAVVGVVQIDGIEQNSSNIEIGAFCGNELRGSNRLFYESKYDRYYLYLTIYGKDDDEISFKIYDHTIESELKLYYNETINFSINDNIGNVGAPKIFNFTTEFLHKRQLSSNWNWYSTFVAVEGRNGFVMLTEGLGELGIQVKSQFAFSNYSAGDWSGGLNTVSTGNMYMIKMSEPTELGMSGIIVEPSEFPIVLSRNWKWIPYPVSVPMDVTTAFAGFTPHDGDIVKSQEGFTQYYEGIGWSGSLNTMIPGEGYMYQNTSGEEKTLYYPSTNEAKGETKTNITSENNYWKPEVSKYPTNMSVIAVVDHSDEYDFEVAAFSNGECRGSARPIYIDGLDKNILFLTIYGEDNETITFRYYDANSGEEYNISNRIIYSTDSTIGNVKEPYVINLIPANVNEITENEVCIYPNPVNTNSEIHLTTECDRVEVYNSLGVKISEHENVDRIDGIEVSGVYIIKVVKEGVIKYNRIVVK